MKKAAEPASSQKRTDEPATARKKKAKSSAIVVDESDAEVVLVAAKPTKAPRAKPVASAAARPKLVSPFSYSLSLFAKNFYRPLPLSPLRRLMSMFLKSVVQLRRHLLPLLPFLSRPPRSLLRVMPSSFADCNCATRICRLRLAESRRLWPRNAFHTPRRLLRTRNSWPNIVVH